MRIKFYSTSLLALFVLSLFTKELSAQGKYSGGNGDGYAVSQITNLVLPIKLLSFTAADAGEKIQLQWKAYNDGEIGFFSIERRMENNPDFIAIGSVAFNSVVTGIADYSFADFTTAAGVISYRLKWNSPDGALHYSGIVAVKRNKENIVKLYPNPAYDFIQLEKPVGQASVIIYNMAGQAVRQINVNLIVERISITDLPAGAYQLSLEMKEKKHISCFVKQ